jgi:predicted DCC family thiol-disulfide oxidoreductase YuxK
LHAPSKPSVVYYDGDCDVCSVAVRIIRANDPAARFSFAPLASEPGRAAVIAAGRDPLGEPSLLLADADGVHSESAAALRIAARLRAPWPLLAALVGAVPRPVRDAAYRWLARRRHRYMG